MRDVRAICDRYGIPLFIDACRFAENCLVHSRARSRAARQDAARDRARDVRRTPTAARCRAKKDGLVNIGGFLGRQRRRRSRGRSRNLLILTEGFPTYGGLAGRDLEAMAQGLDEVLDEDYLRYRIASTRIWANASPSGVPIVQPPGRPRDLHRRAGTAAAHPAGAVSRPGARGARSTAKAASAPSRSAR